MVRSSPKTSVLLDLGARYRAQRSLGEGGFGAVYEAIDLETGQKVAVKSLVRTKPDALAHFKREFRALADVSDPHLVGLRELYEHEGTWLIVMELIEGTDLLSWVRGPATANDQGARFEEARLRKAFGGVARGLMALHTHGLLHRDLKPGNVRVTAEGRAVLLDFGLVTLAAPDQQSTQHGAPGTVAYMAPEQAASQKLTPAADFYALGASLFEAITGRLPFDEISPLAMLIRKTQEDPPPPRALNPRVPHDLDWLCSALLDRTAAKRPPPQTILQTLIGSEAAAPSLPSPMLSTSSHEATAPEFEGREPELEVLAKVQARTHEGELGLVIVEGESGIGKSALLSHFARIQREAAPQTWVLNGRCYEHERVPYKALDGCMDGLAKALDKLPSELCRALLPRHAGLVAELFPVLRAVKPLAGTQVSGAPAEPAARRQGAFRALGELLGKLAETRPLILVIDDLQWADLESFHLLHALLASHPPPILIACTVRPEHELSPELRAALAELRKGPHAHWLRLRGLEALHTENLARSLLGARAERALVARLTYECRGHPLLLAELARYAQSHGNTGAELTLDAALTARITALQPAARSLIEALAVSVAPRSEMFFQDLCGPKGFGDALKQLLAERLVRRNSALALQPAHDRIRAAVLAQQTPSSLRHWHRALAQQLEREPAGDASERALHWDEAGEPERACFAYTEAAAAAMNALAFVSAAAHYARAIELLGTAQHENRLSLSTQRARAMAALGNSVEAARLFEEAALLAAGPERVRLRVLAAQHQIQGAQFEAGLANTRAVLAELDVPLPRGQAGAIARIVWERVRIGLRGTGVKPRDDVAASDRMLLDAITGLIFPLSWADFALGNALNMQHLRRALDLGEPGHTARALAQAATLQAMQGNHVEGERLMARAEDLGNSTGDPLTRAFVAFASNCVAMFEGRIRTALAQAALAEQLLVTCCQGETWLLTNVRTTLGSALFSAAEHRQLAERHASWLAEAADQQDLFATAAHQGLGMGYVLLLMRDAPDEALDALQRALGPWRSRPFGFAHFGEDFAVLSIASYAGTRAAWDAYQQNRRRHDAALFYKAGPPRQILQFGRATAALTAMLQAPVAERPALLHAAKVAARRIPDAGLGRICREMLHAQLAAVRGEHELAIATARRTHELCAGLGQQHWALNVSYLLGVLEGGDAGRARCEQALTHFREQGWQDPWRAATLNVPAARLLEGERAPTRPSLFLGRYQLPSQGAAFAVEPLCAALDSRTGRTVTLHSLVNAPPESQARFKQEFRALQSVHHVNLARLEALFEHEGSLTIAMEQVPQTDFLDYVRPSGSLACERLRTALVGALAGLDALHQAGFIHGDVRPSNLRVSDAGRVLLIGRGLVTPLEVQARHSSSLTPEDLAYVAPEQIDRADFDAAADIYSLGVCFYQALTGQLPFDQRSDADLLRAKRRGRPVPPWALGIEVPQDLQELCMAMLDQSPAQRPSVPEVGRRLAGGAAPLRSEQANLPTPRATTGPRAQPFTGRKQELQAIDEALARAEQGQRGLVMVSGESGVGKSALVRHALDRLKARRPDVWVLQSRCYTNEQLGYQAFDSAAEDLARTLRKLPVDTLAELLPARCSLLAHLFPVLGSLPQIREAPKKGLPAEPSARRRAALHAFVELIRRLAQDTLVVFVIDDLQWADPESFELLSALLENSGSAKLLFLVTLRPAEARDEVVAEELRRASTRPEATPLLLSKLGHEEAWQFAKLLVGERATELQIETLVRESAGHPLFMRELAGLLRDAGAADGFDLNQALVMRLERLDAKTRELLELLALAARPCPSHVLERAAAPQSDFDERLRELLRAEWVQQRGAAQLTCTHDRVREAVAAQVSPRRARELYARLAAAFSAEPDCDMTECAALWDGAGDATRAHTAYVQAADAALAALAFATAERLYVRATELAKDVQGVDFAHLLTQHAHALVALGRSARAAVLFEQAAEHSAGERAVRLRVWAAQHQIQSAQFDAGLKNAQAVLAELDVPLARGTAGAIGRIVWERTRLKLRGTKVEPRAQLPARDKLVLDTVADLANPLSWADSLPANALNMYYLRRALALGDPAHAARALAQEGIFCTIAGRYGQGEPLFVQAESLAMSAGDPAARAFVCLAQATAMITRGNVLTVLAKCRTAEELLVTQCPGEAWALTTVKMTLGAALVLVGEHRRFAEQSTLWLAEADERRDAFATTALWGLGHGVVSLLMRDEADAALAMLERSLLPWRGRPYGLAHHGEMVARAWIVRYTGGPEGWTWFAGKQREHERALLYKAGPLREYLLHSRALAALAASFQTSRKERDTLLEIAQAIARSPSSTDYGRILGALLQAQLQGVHQNLDAALAATRSAHALCIELGQVNLEHNAAYLLGLLEGGENGKARREAALGALRAQGWQDALRAATVFVPYARTLA